VSAAKNHPLRKTTLPAEYSASVWQNVEVVWSLFGHEWVSPIRVSPIDQHTLACPCLYLCMWFPACMVCKYYVLLRGRQEQLWGREHQIGRWIVQRKGGIGHALRNFSFASLVDWTFNAPCMYYVCHTDKLEKVIPRILARVCHDDTWASLTN
jgi:hypothetical protein